METNGNLPTEYAGSTVSHGTMRNEDLAPAFLDILDEAADQGILREGDVEDLRGVWEDMGEIAQNEGPGTDFVVELFDRLDAIAPEGTYFGASEGDGSDYGFWYAMDPWEDDEDPEEAERSDHVVGGLLDEIRQAERLIGTE